MYKDQWLETLYEAVFVLAVCIFGFGVQIAYMYLKDKLLSNKKIIALFILNFSVAYFINMVMKKMGWQDWTWIAIWLFCSNSVWLTDVIGAKIKSTVEAAVPAIIVSWMDKLKAKKAEVPPSKIDDVPPTDPEP